MAFEEKKQVEMTLTCDEPSCKKSELFTGDKEVDVNRWYIVKISMLQGGVSFSRLKTIKSQFHNQGQIRAGTLKNVCFCSPECCKSGLSTELMKSMEGDPRQAYGPTNHHSLGGIVQLHNLRI